MTDLERKARKVAEDWVAEWLGGLPDPRYEAAVSDLTRRIVKVALDQAEDKPEETA